MLEGGDGVILPPQATRTMRRRAKSHKGEMEEWEKTQRLL